MSVTELPLLLALFYLAPVTTVVVRVFACVLIQSYRRADAGEACVQRRECRGRDRRGQPDRDFARRTLHPATPQPWMVLTVAVLVSTFMTIASVVGVITLVQGPMTMPPWSRAVVPGMVVGAINTAIGLVLLLVIQASPWAVVLIAGLAVAIGARLSNLCAVPPPAPQPEPRSTTSPGRCRRARTTARWPTCCCTGSAGCCMPSTRRCGCPRHGRYPESLLTARADDRGLLDISATPPLLRSCGDRVRQDGRGRRRSSATTRLARHCAQANVQGRDRRAAALRRGGDRHPRGGRAGCTRSSVFTADDVRLLETIAAHASVAVENSRLVDRLRFDAYHDALTGLPNRRRHAGRAGGGGRRSGRRARSSRS